MKLILALLRIRTNILRVMMMLMSANKKVFLKNQDFLFLSSTKKGGITISKISSLMPSIFKILISVLYI